MDTNTPVRRSQRDEKKTVLVVGDDPVGLDTVRRIATETMLASEVEIIAERARDHATETATVGNPSELVDRIGTTVDGAIVATSRDERNLLFVQQLRVEAGIDDVVVRVNDPQYVRVFDELPVEPVPIADTASEKLARRFRESDERTTDTTIRENDA